MHCSVDIIDINSENPMHCSVNMNDIHSEKHLHCSVNMNDIHSEKHLHCSVDMLLNEVVKCVQLFNRKVNTSMFVNFNILYRKYFSNNENESHNLQHTFELCKLDM